MKRPSPALGVWMPVGRPEVGAKCSLFGPPRRAASVSPQQTGYLSGPVAGSWDPTFRKISPRAVQSCSRLPARSLGFQSVDSLGQQEPLLTTPDPILYSRPLCVGARDSDAGEITQN